MLLCDVKILWIGQEQDYQSVKVISGHTVYSLVSLFYSYFLLVHSFQFSALALQLGDRKGVRCPIKGRTVVFN